MKEHFRPFHKLLIKNRIIDRHFQWIYDEGHLVVLGNSFDDMEPAIEYLWFLYSLEQKARLHGGCVHFIPGLHEIMHINGKWRKEHPPYPSATAKVRRPITALYDANFELRRWLGARNVIESIGNLLFVHGDVCPVLNSDHQSIGDINAFVRSIYRSLPEALPDELPTSLLGDNDSVLTKELVDCVLKKFGVDVIITGQAIQEQVTTALNGKLINIPTRHAIGNPAGLLIKHSAFLQVDRQGRQKKINF